jgi:signal transduction histidine kinase
MESLNIRLILEELIGNYRFFIEQKDITLVTEIGDITARLNRVYITQIIDNLLSNAIKFTPEGKTIRIMLTEKEGRIEFCVCDDGPGIEKSRIENLFDQYRRQVSMFNQHLPQDGLGLAIVYKYTIAMNGTVRCDSEPGKGTRFFVNLPV